MKKKPSEKAKKAGIQGLTSDITLVPSQFIDASATQVVGGMIQAYEVEMGEELDPAQEEGKKYSHKEGGKD